MTRETYLVLLVQIKGSGTDSLLAIPLHAIDEEVDQQVHSGVVQCLRGERRSTTQTSTAGLFTVVTISDVYVA